MDIQSSFVGIMCKLGSQSLVHLKAPMAFSSTQEGLIFFLENVLLLLLKEHTSNSDTHRGIISFLWRSDSHPAPEWQLQALCSGPQSKHLPYCSLNPFSLVVTWIPSFAAKPTSKLYTFEKGNLQDWASQRRQDEEGSFFKPNYT